MNIIAPAYRVGDILSTASEIYVSACAAEIVTAPDLLGAHAPRNATVTGIFSPMVNHRSYANPPIGMRMRSFFLGREINRALAEGYVDYCPWRYGVIDRWLSSTAKFDTALVMASPPGPDGKCSLGVQVDFLPGFIGRIDRVIGFINPNMPRTAGDSLIDYRAFAALVDHDAPLLTMEPPQADETTGRIAAIISNLIPDGATVQVGIGKIPSQVLAQLRNHRDLRINTGVIDDNILALEQSGALDTRFPIVTGTAVGTARLYDAVSDPRFSFRAVSHTHARETLVNSPRFTAVNSVLQADLFGQISAEGAGGKMIASPGGLPDFVRGALDCDGGRSMIAVRARGPAGTSGIVASLRSPANVTSPANDADVIVTEFGAAQVRHLSTDARAEALISIAAPEHRDQLAEDWRALRVGDQETVR
jgi:acyl-CoA hydrolase